MKHRLRYSTARLWALKGLLGLVFIGGVLLDEGQAGTFSTPQAIEVSQIQIPNHPQIHKNASALVKNYEIESTPIRPREKERHQDSFHKQEPAKKKLGLALLFLGVLAEKS